jgi:hypothetical protein
MPFCATPVTLTLAVTRKERKEWIFKECWPTCKTSGSGSIKRSARYKRWAQRAAVQARAQQAGEVGGVDVRREGHPDRVRSRRNRKVRDGVVGVGE